MDTVLKPIDALLNRFTMYRVLVYSLGGFLVVSLVLALFDVIGVSPLGLLVSAVALMASCYVANYGLSRLLRVPVNSESWLISALILCCIMPPATTFERAALLAMTGALAMTAKFVLVYRGNHLFNPAAIAAVVMSLTGLLPASWWIATPPLAICTALLAAVIVRKTRLMSMFFCFVGVSLGLMIVLGLIQGQSIAASVRNLLLSWPLFFLGGVMLTEPGTLPPIRRYRLLFAAIVGSIFVSQLHAGIVSSTPQLALVLGNLFGALAAPARGWMLRLISIKRLSPSYFELSFAPPDNQQLVFEPGQYMEWTLPHPHADSRGNRRTFSIASAPSDDVVRIATKQVESGSSFKRAFLGLQPGQRVRAAHIAGNFTLPRDTTQPLVFIAGGIGITPFHSMIAQLIAQSEQRDITLLYLASNPKDFVYKDTFAAAEAWGVSVQYITGSATAEQLQAVAPRLAESTVYLSGPDAMVQSYRHLLRRLGVSATHIVTDHFTGY